jgi:hypothetical protein
MTGLLQLIVVLVVLGLVWWLVTTYVPLPQPVKTIITVLAVLVLCLYLLSFAGLIGPLNLH